MSLLPPFPTRVNKNSESLLLRYIWVCLLLSIVVWLYSKPIICPSEREGQPSLAYFIRS